MAEQLKGAEKKDELIDIVSLPLAVLSRNRKISKLTVSDSKKKIVIVGSNKFGIPCSSDLDYFYAITNLLINQISVEPSTKTVYFTLNKLIQLAGKKKSQQEYKRALEALEKFKDLKVFIKTQGSLKGNNNSFQELILIKDFNIQGGLLRGRKKGLNESSAGYCCIVFSDFFLTNISSRFKDYNVICSFLQKLSSSLSKRFFIIIESLRKKYIASSNSKALEVNIFDIAKKIPLSNYKYPSQIQRILTPVHEELINLKYLRATTYGGEHGDLIKYEFFLSPIEALTYNELKRSGCSDSICQKLITHYPSDFLIDVIRYCRLKSKDSTQYIIDVISHTNPVSIKKMIQEQIEILSRVEKERLQKQREYKRLFVLYEKEIESSAFKIFGRLSGRQRKEILSEVKTKIRQLSIAKHEQVNVMERELVNLIKKRFKLPSFEQWYKNNKGHVWRH